MTTRLKKEIRPLLLPCIIAFAGGLIGMCCIPLLNALSAEFRNPYDWHYSVKLLGPVGEFAFFACLIIAATVAFGVEFEERTLPLLLSLPAPRYDLWWQKVKVSLFAVGGTALLCLLLAWPTHAFIRSVTPAELEEGRFYVSMCLLTAGFLLATVCSAGFWTLVARSTIGGVTFNLGSQFLATVGAIYLLEHGLGIEGEYQDPRFTAIFLGLSVPYSALFLWLGRRTFSRFQVRDEGTRAWQLPVWRTLDYRSAARLRPRPTGPVMNLLRKEIGLHQPLFMVGAIFAAAWLLTLGLSFVLSQRQELCANILNVLSVIFIPLASVLAGCGPLGEEKRLGINSWQLTLPVSLRTQWLVKLLAGLAAVMVVAWILPMLLSVAVSPKLKVVLFLGLENLNAGLIFFPILSGSLFLISFWAATIVRTTIRAALDSVVAFFGLVACGVAGFACAKTLLDGLGKIPALEISARYQLSPDILSARVCIYLSWFTLVVLLAILARQGYSRFRYLHIRRRTIVGHCCVLALTVAGLFMLTEDIRQSGAKATSDFTQLLQTALTHYVRHEGSQFNEATNAQPVTLTLADLGKNATLPVLLQKWLKGGSVTFLTSQPSKRERRFVIADASVLLPNGEDFGVRFQEPIQLNGPATNQPAAVQQLAPPPEQAR